MSHHTDFVKDQILEKIIPLMFRNIKMEVSLKEICEITGVFAPTLYNYFGGINDINEAARKKINNRILELSETKLPVSIPANLIAVTMAYNMIKFLENSEYPAEIITGAGIRGINTEPLRNKFEILFGQMKGLKHDPLLSVHLLFNNIAAHVEYSRIKKEPICEEIVEKIFNQILIK